MPSVHRTTVELTLAAITNHPGEDGMMHSFLFSSEPNAAVWRSNLGAEIFFSQRSMVKAALFVQNHGPAYLRSIAIEDIQRMLQDFIKANFSYIAPETFFHKFQDNYAEKVSDATKISLTRALSESMIFSPISTLTVFPLVTIHVEQDFSSPHYFICSPQNLYTEVSPLSRPQLIAKIFPPLVDTKTRIAYPSAWLGIRSPFLQTSKKMKTAILGALALSLPLNLRYMFSGRETFGGHCTISDVISFAFGDSHTPPIHRDIFIRAPDEPWLNLLSKQILSSKKGDNRNIRALEYFYRAWHQGRTERFPFLCMALDALFSEAGKATQSVIEGIQNTLGSQIDDKRLRMLMDLRAAVIHGGAPDAHGSSKYRKYYQEFLSDPVDDLDDVLAESMRRRVFGDTFNVQKDESAVIVAKLQRAGRLPRQMERRGILNNT